MSCQVWDKNGNIHHISIEDFEASVSAGIYTVTDPKSESTKQDEPVKRTRKTKAVADENQD